MEAFNASLSFDQRLAQADLNGSKVYVKGLHRAGLINTGESTQLLEGLDQVAHEWRSSQFLIKPSDEDIHTANERRLGEIVGSVAGKLHTGRSRNDQVATDMRLWLKDECRSLLGHVKELIRVATGRAAQEIDVLMPGYTHLQVL